jgi:hypothetical protein
MAMAAIVIGDLDPYIMRTCGAFTQGFAPPRPSPLSRGTPWSRPPLLLETVGTVEKRRWRSDIDSSVKREFFWRRTSAAQLKPFPAPYGWDPGGGPSRLREVRIYLVPRTQCCGKTPRTPYSYSLPGSREGCSRCKNIPTSG